MTCLTIPALRAYLETIDWIETVLRRLASPLRMSEVVEVLFIEMKSGSALSVLLSV